MQPSHGRDAALTVFLGRGRLAHGIRQTMEDFTATGLVRELVWVDADAFESSSSPVTHLHLDGDGVPRITREPFNVLVARSGKNRIHLGVINVVGPDDSQLGSAELSTLLNVIDSVSTGLHVHRTNLIVSAVGAPHEDDLPILRGYTNLMLAPEDSPGPEAATVPFHFDRLDNRFTLHCVAGVASLFGLWEGSATAPVSALEPANGTTFRLVRAFYRRIDGQEVQARLKARILDTEDNPLPRLDLPGQDASAQYTENPEAFAATAAEDLLQEFNRRLEGARNDALVEQTRETTSGKAVGEFLGTWWRKFRTTPQRFWAEFRSESSSLIDDTAQSAIYGSHSGTHVGRAPGVHHAEEGTFGSAGGPAHPDQVHQAAKDLGQLWVSYANTAMSLLDAQARPIFAAQGGVARPRVVAGREGSQVQVARRSADVIPGPSRNFGEDVPVEVKADIGGSEIAPYDVLGIADYERSLSDHRHGGQRNIGKVIGDFKQWQQDNSTSFAYFVGRGLVDKRDTLREHEKQLEHQLAEAEKHEQEPKGSGRAGGVFRWLGWVTFWSLAVFLLLWGYGNLRTDDAGVPMWQWVRNLNGAPTGTLVWMLSIWLGLWLLFWIIQVVFETRNEIQVMHRRRTMRSREEATRRNLRATREARVRIDVGYQQFLSMSQMMGALLERPFGKVTHLRVDSTIPVNTMPDSVVFAEASPHADAVERLATSFRREIYREGWLNTYVLGALQEAATDFEARSDGRIAVNDVFGTTGRGTAGQLSRLADWVTGQEFSSRDRSREKWREIAQQLREGSHRNDAEILSPQQMYRSGKKHVVSSQPGLADVREVGSFNGEIATERGRVNGILDLDPRYCTYDRNINTFDAIGVSEVLVQVGESASQNDVALHRATRERISEEILHNMPVSEDSRPQSGSAVRSPQPRHQLPGMGEF